MGKKKPPLGAAYIVFGCLAGSQNELEFDGDAD